MIAAAQYQSGAENRAAADAIRKRLMAPGKPKPPSAPREIVRVVRYMAPQIPLWERQAIHFDAHYVNWQYDRTIWGTPDAYLKRRCVALKIPYALMIGSSRMREIVIRRQLVQWEVIKTFGLSFPAVGRLFGGFDHTTILHSFRKIDAMTDEQREEIGRPVRPIITKRYAAAKQMGVGE